MIHLNQDTFHAIVVRHEGLIRTLKVGDIITSPLQNRWLVHLWNGDKQTLSNIFLNKENKKRMVTKLTRSFFLLSLSWDPEGSKSFKLLIWSLMVSRYLHTQRSVIKIGKNHKNQKWQSTILHSILWEPPLHQVVIASWRMNLLRFLLVGIRTVITAVRRRRFYSQIETYKREIFRHFKIHHSLLLSRLLWL